MDRRTFGTASGSVAYWVEASAGPDAPWLVFLPSLTADRTLFDAQTAHFAGKERCPTCPRCSARWRGPLPGKRPPCACTSPSEA